MINLAISDLAWNSAEDTKVLELLATLGIKYLEISPFKNSSDPSAINSETAKSFHNTLHPYAIQVAAMQALLYRHPNMQLFKSSQARKKTYDHLLKLFSYAGKIGAKTLVFGSPKNKIRGSLPYTKALDVAKNFFFSLGKKAQRLVRQLFSGHLVRR